MDTLSKPLPTQHIKDPIFRQPLNYGTQKAKITSSKEMRIPAWYLEHMQPVNQFISSLKPNPFDQPKNIANYIALHQNDYLRLGNHPLVVEARSQANEKNRDEAFLSSIYGGNSDECEAFRLGMASCMKASDTILTTSGWAANVGLLEAITPLFKPVYIDKYAHASLYDGIKLSIGKIVVVNHNDPDHLIEKIKINGPGIVVIDGVYSTDGSISDIHRYVDICEENDCIMVLDEAHSFGIFGHGGGLAIELDVQDRVHFRTVSLNKALGGHGGLIAGDKAMMKLVRAGCRSVIFSSATSSVSAAGHNAALSIMRNEPERAKRCLKNASYLRNRLTEIGVDTGDSQCQIVSITFKSEQGACEFYDKMKKNKILTSVFLYPAIARQCGLVRFSMHSEFTSNELDRTVASAKQVLTEMGVIKSNRDGPGS